MADDYRRTPAEADDYRRRQYAKQVEADMKKQRNERIKKYATYAGSVVMIFVIVILVVQMGGGAFLADLFDGTKKDTGAPMPEQGEAQSGEDFVWEDIPETAGDKEQAATNARNTARIADNGYLGGGYQQYLVQEK